ncbi:hypothetical protein VTJ83DRAFT_5961 [Remersonia thermophila]|uniref:Methyltransferase n=1 Tax=Remersonia thermophila TaxID=72144 RepID=A0ABR4DAI3_9PEZI
MLPTPSTSHVPYSRVYEPAEDSFLLLDTFSQDSETSFLSDRFPTSSPTPLLLEVGPGSGVVLAFLTAHAATLFGRSDVLTLGVDVNWFACEAAKETVRRAVKEAEEEEEAAAEGEVGKRDGENNGEAEGEGRTQNTRNRKSGRLLATAQGDLASPLRPGAVDVLVFNPPYVPTDELPTLPKELADPAAATPAVATTNDDSGKRKPVPKTTYAQDSTLLALAYAGGRDGMEVTDRLLAAVPDILSQRGVAYVLLCAQNRPEEVKARVRAWESDGGRWMAETVGSSGNKAGWERLQIVRIWRAVA